MEEKEPVKRLNIEVPLSLHCEVKARAVLRNIQMTEYVIRALTEKVQKEKIYD